LAGLNYIFGNGPSAQQSFAVTGSYLIANIVLTPPTDYEISTTSGSGFQSTPITLTQTGGTVASTTIYVRLKAGLAIGSYNLENIALTSTTAVTKNVASSGTVSSVPLITVAPTSLTGFNYIFGYGPSSQQSFTVSGSNLVANITVAPSTNYEISTTSGSGFQSTAITLTQSSGTVALTTIYVRLKAGLAVGSYNLENIVSTSTSAVTKNVAASGTVSNVPLITVAPTSLTGFNYIVGYGPSAQQSFTVSGSYLVSNVIVTPPTDYEISTISGSGFQSTAITLTQSGGTVASTTIYARLKAGLVAGNYNSENITSTATTAVTQNVTCSGTVTTPTITTSPATLTGFSYSVGNGPSAQQSFTVSGVNLPANIIVTPSTNYEISTTSGAGFQSTAITLTQSGGTVASTTIYVRLKAGLAVGTYNSENIASSATGAVTQNVTCSGTVGTPTITTSIASLTGFTYSYGSGPSGEQSFTVNGSYLTTNLVVTPPTDFEISTTSGSGFQSTPILLTPTSGIVNTTTIYVRLKAGLITGSYASENIVATSTGATTKNVVASGSVYVTYCSSAGTTATTTSITLVSFNTINNVTAKPAGYSDYTSSPTDVSILNPYNLRVNLNTAGNNRVYATAWIDWNHNGNFTDAGESYNLGNSLNVTNGITSLSPLSITIPATALAGNTRMRVSAKLTVASTACETGFTGEVEDYTLNVIIPTITTGTITGSPFASGAAVSVPFTITGSYVSGNVFTAQLSDASGSFASPVSIGTLTSTSAGTISGTIPVNATSGTGYRIRVVSSTPAITGSANGSDLTINAVPYIAVTPTTITTFSYPVGYGPSSERSFTVSGVNLTANILLTPSTNFEISLTSSSAGTFVPTSLITLPVSGGVVGATTIYVRMKAGLPLGAVAGEDINATTTGATSKLVTCSGTVVAAPVITTSVSTLTGFSYVFTAGPSTQQSFTVSGTNLVDNIVVTPPVDYEISTTSGSGFVSTPITLTQTGGTLGTTAIYARLKIGLGVGSYSENVVVSTTSATPKNVVMSGAVTASATIIASTSSLAGFIYTLGSGPSTPQSFGLTGSNLGTNNITVTAPTNFEISTTSGGTYAATLSFTPSSGSVNTTVYARLKSGLAVASYGPSNVALTSTGAVVKTVALSGSVVNTPTILTSKSTLTGFGYMFGTGPSSVQSLTVSGASLTANIIVTPPANFEISTSAGSGFQSTALTLTRTSGLVSPTIIYVRLKSGLAAGNYTGVNITAASTGVTTKNVACVGIVFVSPLITAGGGGELCAGSTINLTSIGAEILNRYWQGPNSYYSTLQNPTIANATPAMSGTYTVTGNVYVGGNLITNGDFEAGNTSFGSSYGYVAPIANALWPEALYTVVASPLTVHDNFSACVDHTIGGATPTGLQMVINGAPTAGVVIWTQSVPVIPNASYEFSYWVQTVVATSPSQLQLYVNGVAAGPTYTADLTTCTWKQFIYNTTAGSSTTSLNLELINQNTIANGNDFALDDIVFKQTLPATSSTNVTVNPTLPVSVVVAASANPVYSNTPVTYTATPTNGGTAPAYQWKVNGVNVGTNSSTYTYTPVNGDVITCVLTSNYPCPTGNPATASVVMVVNLRTNYWMGYIDTDWGKPGNWTNNFVPLTGDDVEYATVANFGTSAMKDLQLDMDRTIGSLINATTKRLLIPRQKGLTVNNTISTDGNAARIYIYCDSITANGSLTFHNSVSSPVYATVEMYSRAFWNLSDPDPSNRYHWQYFGIPLESIVAYPAFSGAYVRQWYETGTAIYNHWIQLSNSSTLVPFYGYELCQRSSRVYYFQGRLVNRDFNSGQLAVTPTGLYPGQHVFANPYTAAIDIRQLTFGSQTEQTVYMYNTGTYNQWTSGGEAAPGNNPGQYTSSTKQLAGSNGLPRQVPSMQAMLVKAMSNSASATFGISYNSVVMNNAVLQRVSSIDEESATGRVSTLIDVKGAHANDRMWIFSEPTCTRGFDNGWDGPKMLGTSLSPQLYAVESDGNYQVNAVADMNDTQLAFQAGSDVEYTLTFTHQNLKRYYPGVYLVDAVENKIVDITETGSTYTFAAATTPEPVNRFRIVTRYYEKDAPDESSSLKVFSAKGMIFVHNFSNRNGDAMLYDVSGHYIKKIPFSSNGITIVRAGVVPGAYVAKCITETEEVTKRIIVR
jgi:hypothetical protein